MNFCYSGRVFWLQCVHCVDLLLRLCLLQCLVVSYVLLKYAFTVRSIVCVSPAQRRTAADVTVLLCILLSKYHDTCLVICVL